MIASDGWTITDGGAEFIIADPITLFPPDFIYQTIELSQLFVSVSCLAISIDDVYIASVSSDEEEDLPGGVDGNTVDDIVISQDCQSVQLRRERNFRLNGRVYTINLSVDAGFGDIGFASVQVYVPRSLNETAIDDGVAYQEICGNGLLPFIPVKDDQIDGLVTVDDYDSYSIDVKFWPNPSKSIFNLKFNIDNNVKVAIYVYDITGRLVHQKASITSNTYQFGELLKSGIYFVNLILGDKTQLLRLVKY